MSANASESRTEGKLAVVVGASVADEVCRYCCIRPAEIFQVTGNYCIECWQELTYPNVKLLRSVHLDLCSDFSDIAQIVRYIIFLSQIIQIDIIK
jgi:hypothetical protein